MSQAESIRLANHNASRRVSAQPGPSCSSSPSCIVTPGDHLVRGPGQAKGLFLIAQSLLDADALPPASSGPAGPFSLMSAASDRSHHELQTRQGLPFAQRLQDGCPLAFAFLGKLRHGRGRREAAHEVGTGCGRQ